MNNINLFPFISLINNNNDLLECETCHESIKDGGSYIVDGDKDYAIYCDSTCVTRSFSASAGTQD